MIQKNAISKGRKFIRRSAAVLFVAESLGFLLCYKVWHKLNTEIEFRKYMRDNHPGILESYYSLGETLGSNDIRALDTAQWNQDSN